MEIVFFSVPCYYGNGVPCYYGNQSHVTMEISPMLLWKWICASRENQAVAKFPNKK